MFAKGDLIHVPQSTILYGGGAGAQIYINQKPSLALFLDYADSDLAKIVMNGQHWLVKKKEIYLNKQGD